MTIKTFKSNDYENIAAMDSAINDYISGKTDVSTNSSCTFRPDNATLIVVTTVVTA